ncbi:hypothetical protein ACSQ67_001253 [Phaseolus vulgaris]
MPEGVLEERFRGISTARFLSQNIIIITLDVVSSSESRVHIVHLDGEYHLHPVQRLVQLVQASRGNELPIVVLVSANGCLVKGEYVGLTRKPVLNADRCLVYWDRIKDFAGGSSFGVKEEGRKFARRSKRLSNGYQQFSTSFSVVSRGNILSMGCREFLARRFPLLDSQSTGNLNSQMGIGVRSGLLQKPITNSNGAINSGYGLIGNNIQLANEPDTSFSYASTYANSRKHLHRHFDQNQKQVR